MSVKVVKNSRLRFGELLLLDGIEFWNTLDLPALPIQPDDIQYQVQATDRIDLLAYKFYGDPVLWWVIATANDLELIPNDLSVGGVLRIPSVNFVQSVLFKSAPQLGSQSGSG
jgi:hypothetical protein